MSTENLKVYIINCLKRGFDKEAVLENVSKAGWPDEELEKVLSDPEVRSLLSENERSEDITPDEDKDVPEGENEEYNDEVNQSLKYYIVDNLKEGFDPADIRSAVLDAGWPEDEVEKVFKSIEDLEDSSFFMKSDTEELPDPKEVELNDPHSPDKQISKKGFKSFTVPFAHKPNSELINYVVNEVKKGNSRLAIKEAARDAGWPEDEVEKVFDSEAVRHIFEDRKNGSLNEPKKENKEESDDFLDPFINRGDRIERKDKVADEEPKEKNTSRNPFFDIFSDLKRSSSDQEEKSVQDKGGKAEEDGVDEAEPDRSEGDEDMDVLENDTGSDRGEEGETQIGIQERDPRSDLRDYVMNEMKRGVSRLAIKTVAVDAGWPGKEVDEIFNEKELKDLLKNRNSYTR